MKIFTILKSISLCTMEEIFPAFFYVRNKSRKMREAISKELVGSKLVSKYQKLSAEYLKIRLKEEQQRATSMDEKTFKMTLSLSFGLTILGTTAALIIKQISAEEIQNLLSIFLFFSLAYILSGGFIALGALKTLPSFGYGTVMLQADSPQYVDMLAENLARQETINTLRHLRNEASYQSLRNGLILLFAAFLVFSATLAVESWTVIR